MSEGELDYGGLVGGLGGDGDVVAVDLEGDLSVGVVDETVFVLACYTWKEYNRRWKWIHLMANVYQQTGSTVL